MTTQKKFFTYQKELKLESGETFPRFTLAYNTFGQLNKSKTNVVWIIHALTADQNPLNWWSEIVGPGLSIDTNKYFVICANTIGSHYGSTSPLSMNNETQSPYYHDFPRLTNRDIVKTFDLLSNSLGITTIMTLIGPSIGGQQALEWAIMKPDKIKNLVLIASNAVHSPYGIAFNESQRMAIRLDPTWTNKDENAGINGMQVARSIALISYRTKYGYDTSQNRFDSDSLFDYKASSYQNYQGEKLAKRFNAFTYYLFTQVMDSHDVCRGRSKLSHVLGKIKAKTHIIGIESDILFPIEEQELLKKHILNSRLHKLKSNFGHDGFLVETKQLFDLFQDVFREFDYNIEHITDQVQAIR